MVQVTTQWVRSGIWLGWLLPVVVTKLSECIDGRDEAAPRPLLAVTLGVCAYIQKTMVVGFEEDSPTISRGVPFVGM